MATNTIVKITFKTKFREKTTIKLMEFMSSMFEKSLVNKVYLMKKFFNLKMSKGITIKQYLNNFNTILN
jgi:hypothetical protein